MSLGGGGPSSFFDAACEAAHDDGIVVVAAAGNDGVDDCSGAPTSEPKTIVVGATDYYDDFWYNYGECVDILAPGISIYAACTPRATQRDAA